MELPGDAREPPREALAILAPLSRAAPVHEVARLDTLRRTTAWVDREGRRVLSVIDDDVVIRRRGFPVRRRRVVSIEPAADAPPELVTRSRAALGALADRAATAAESPAAVALGDDAAAPPDVEVPAAGRRSSAREVIRSALATGAHDLLVHLPHARVGDDPEGVHQARVAIRRLRSARSTFRGLLDREAFDALDPHLRELGRALGRVRDDDVLLALLARAAARDDVLDTPGATRLAAHVRERRDAHRRALIGTLDEPTTLRALDRLVDLVHDPRCAPTAGDPAADVLPPLVRRRYRKLARLVDRAGPDPSPDELHRIRILARHTRYAAEAVAPAVGRHARRFARALARLQDLLGEINDAAVATGTLRAITRDADPAESFVAGRLSGRLALRAEEERARWPEAWRRASRPKLRAWL